jgi:hypothetical protein
MLSTKSDWVVHIAVLLISRTNAEGEGVGSPVEQFGPRAPINEVFPTRILFSTVKLVADDIAMA